MDTTASSFTLRKNAKRAAEAMIRKGTAPAVDYGIKPSDDGRFEIVWKSAKPAPTTDEVETEIAEAPANQPAAASPTEDASPHAPAATELATTDAAPQPASEAEAASQPAPAATEPAPALSEPAPKNEWPHGTRVMVRKRKSWRGATIVSRLDPDHWRAEYPGGGSGMFQEADIRAYEAERDATPAKQPRRATATAPQKSSRSRYAIDPETITAGRLPQKGAGRDLSREPPLPEAFRPAVRPRQSRRLGWGAQLRGQRQQQLFKNGRALPPGFAGRARRFGGRRPMSNHEARAEPGSILRHRPLTYRIVKEI